MMQSIYTPMSGALAQEKVLSIIANNLANMNTAGFKGDTVTFKLLEPQPEKNYATPLPPANFKVNFEDVMPLRGNEFAYVGVADVQRDLTQGPAVNTGNRTDLMIEGKGFFEINTPDGPRYTRSGNFNLSPEGILVTPSGHPVLGERGAIAMKSGEFEINRRGEVYQNNTFIDRIQLHAFKNDVALERVGNNYFYFGGAPDEKTILKDPVMSQGMLEGSNVSAIKNLTAMIVAHRSYEAYQKTISNYDKMMDKSSNAIGEVRA